VLLELKVGRLMPRHTETDEDDLAEMMVGRNVQLVVDRGESHPAEPELIIEKFSVADDRGRVVVKDIDLEVRAGEIVGIAGVAGNGQDELVAALTGLRRPAAGRVTLGGKDVTGWGPREMTDFGVGYVPGDRQRYGLVLSFPIEDNLVLTSYYREPFASGPVRNDPAIRDWAEESIAAFDIRTPSATVPASNLSGGNQQKVIVAREFSGQPRLLILDQPTRGLDVGSIEFIHRRAIAKRDAGSAILLVSAELDEVMELSDRIAVMFRGEIVALVDGPTAEREEIGLLMATGGKAPLAEVTTTMSVEA
jgi:simple sugar transport system ATP-binding protein